MKKAALILLVVVLFTDLSRLWSLAPASELPQNPWREVLRQSIRPQTMKGLQGQLEKLMGDDYREEQDRGVLDNALQEKLLADPDGCGQGFNSFEELISELEKPEEEIGMGRAWLLGSQEDVSSLGGDIVRKRAVLLENYWRFLIEVVFSEKSYPRGVEWPYGENVSRRLFRLMDRYMELSIFKKFDLFRILGENMQRLPYSYFLSRFLNYFLDQSLEESLWPAVTPAFVVTLICYLEFDIAHVHQAIPGYVWLEGEGNGHPVPRVLANLSGAKKVSSIEMIAEALDIIGQRNLPMLVNAYLHIWETEEPLSPRFMNQLEGLLLMPLTDDDHERIGQYLVAILQVLAQEGVVERDEEEVAQILYQEPLQKIMELIQQGKIRGITAGSLQALVDQITPANRVVQLDARFAEGAPCSTTHLTPAGTGPVQRVEDGLVELRTDAAGQLQAVADWSHPVLRWLKPLSDKGLLEPNFTYVIQVVRNSLPLAYTVAGQEAGRATIYVHERVLAHAENVVMQEIAYKECVWRSAEQAKQLAAVRALGPAVAEAEFGDNWFQYGLRIVSNRNFLEAFQVSGEQFLADMGELYRQGVLLQEYEGRSLQESDLGASGFYTLVVRPDGVQQLLDSYELQQDTLWRAA